MKLSIKKPIGGYFELELQKGREFHINALSLNTGRNCLEYILKVRNYDRVYIPYYTCDVILESFYKTKTKFDFYKINKSLEPIDISLRNNEALIYTNYFGIKSNAVKKLSGKYKNLIIDNSQAFFDKPIKGIDTFYSPRKFFGVPDGGYLYTKKLLTEKFDKDISYKRFEHLLKRIDLNAELGYKDYIKNDRDLSNQPIKFMSSLTKKILMGLDYEKVKNIRQENFEYLRFKLMKYNELKIDSLVNVPLVYPLFIRKIKLRNILIRNGIYVAKYWDNVIKWVKKSYLENELVNYLVPLPIDQRYIKRDLDLILKVIKDCI